MKRTLILTALLFLVVGVQAQFRSYPRLPHSVQDLDDFIPDGWVLYDEASGDLNKDGMDDYAFVLQSIDSIPAEAEDHVWSVADYPRILGIAFWDEEENAYRLKVQSNKFVITREGNGAMDEPYEGLEIRSNGTLRFDFRYWYSAGTWYTGTSTYIFRYQNGRFELIGQELYSVHRATMESSTTSINYSTRKANLSIANENGEGTTETATFEIDELPTFRSIGAAGFVAAIEL